MTLIAGYEFPRLINGVPRQFENVSHAYSYRGMQYGIIIFNLVSFRITVQKIFQLDHRIRLIVAHCLYTLYKNTQTITLERLIDELININLVQKCFRWRTCKVVTEVA